MAEREFKHLVRISNADLDGRKQVEYALCSVKGVSIMFAHAICAVAGINPSDKAGYLTDDEIERLDTLLKDTSKIPTWMLNRKRDYDSGENKHLLEADLTYTQENDIRRLKTIQAYRGIRHQFGLPTRGQRTKSHFRKDKTANAKKKKRTSKKVVPQKGEQ
jgi:small subunit ribosomal protein S13